MKYLDCILWDLKTLKRDAAYWKARRDWEWKHKKLGISKNGFKI